MEEHPVILWLMVADHALLDTQGKLSVIGMFDRLFAPQFPSVHPIAFIIAQWQWRPSTVLGSELRVFGPSGELLVGAAQQLQTGPDGKTAHIVRLSPIPLPAAGAYTIEVLGNNRSAAHMTLTVEQVPAQ
jgi:hypothetical protein